MSDRLAAHHENRVYYFFVESIKDNEVKINMYGTPYSLLRSGEAWVNSPSNQMEMKKGLVAAVMVAVGIV